MRKGVEIVKGSQIGENVLHIILEQQDVAGEIGHMNDTYLPFSVTTVRREVSVIAL